MAQSIHNEHSKIKLGFVEEVDRRLLSSRFFPSKVGGKPAWLSLEPLPDSDDVKCDNCGGPTVFLAQVYAPLKKDDNFHRSVFVFVCTQNNCAKENDNRNFKVLRSQLPLHNNFYSDEPPNEDMDSDDDDGSSYPDAKQFQNLCHVCGVKSSKKCAKCKKVYYCSREHQTFDWKFKHKGLCDEIAQDATGSLVEKDGCQDHKLLFKEYDLVTEEEEDDSQMESSKRKTIEERMEEYNMMMQALRIKSGSENEKYSEEDLDKAAAKESDDDKHFLYFKKKIESEPTQVLRYDRGGEPLWVSAFHKPAASDVPVCKCGSQRIFEFQVMPQLLHYIQATDLDLDWGTLCVYTCADSCSIGDTYCQEFVWKQDFHDGQRHA